MKHETLNKAQTRERRQDLILSALRPCFNPTKQNYGTELSNPKPGMMETSFTAYYDFDARSFSGSIERG